jgi:hypothetical protein
MRAHTNTSALVYAQTRAWSARLLAWPRAAQAVPSCAGAYVSGANGSNECPAGSVRIETEAACRTAAAAMGMTAGSSSYPFADSYANYPRGCYYVTNVYLNTHAVGAGKADAKLLCAAGALLTLHADARARACTPRVCAATREIALI